MTSWLRPRALGLETLTPPPSAKVRLTRLVDEGSKFVVEGLDLLTLCCADFLDLWVNLHLKRCQQALVDCDFLNTSSRTDGEARTSSTVEGASKTAAKTTGTKSSTISSNTEASDTPVATALAGPSHAHGDTLVTPEIVKTPAAEAPRGAAPCTPRHGA